MSDEFVLSLERPRTTGLRADPSKSRKVLVHDMSPEDMSVGCQGGPIFAQCALEAQSTFRLDLAVPVAAWSRSLLITCFENIEYTRGIDERLFRRKLKLGIKIQGARKIFLERFRCSQEQLYWLVLTLDSPGERRTALGVFGVKSGSFL